MTNEQINDALAICAAASEGPWTIRQLSDGKPSARGYGSEYFKYDSVGEHVYMPAYTVPEVETVGNHECGAMEIHNATFIAASKTGWPQALDALQTERAERSEEAKEFISQVADECQHRKHILECLQSEKQKLQAMETLLHRNEEELTKAKDDINKLKTQDNHELFKAIQWIKTLRLQDCKIVE